MKSCQNVDCLWQKNRQNVCNFSTKKRQNFDNFWWILTINSTRFPRTYSDCIWSWREKIIPPSTSHEIAIWHWFLFMRTSILKNLWTWRRKSEVKTSHQKKPIPAPFHSWGLPSRIIVLTLVKNQTTTNHPRLNACVNAFSFTRMSNQKKPKQSKPTSTPAWQAKLVAVRTIAEKNHECGIRSRNHLVPFHISSQISHMLQMNRLQQEDRLLQILVLALHCLFHQHVGSVTQIALTISCQIRHVNVIEVCRPCLIKKGPWTIGFLFHLTPLLEIHFPHTLLTHQRCPRSRTRWVPWAAPVELAIQKSTNCGDAKIFSRTPHSIHVFLDVLVVQRKMFTSFIPAKRHRYFPRQFHAGKRSEEESETPDWTSLNNDRPHVSFTRCRLRDTFNVLVSRQEDKTFKNVAQFSKTQIHYFWPNSP